MTWLSAVLGNLSLLRGLGILLFLGIIWFIGDSAGLKRGQIGPLLTFVGGLLVVALSVSAVRGYLARRRRTRKIRGQASMARRNDLDLAGDFEELQDDFRAALSRISLEAGRRARDIPWILVIGPRAAGKTSALVASGLDLTLLSHSSSGPSGTRDLDIWLSEAGVFIDTTGKSTASPDIDPTWSALFDLIHRHRPRQMLDGVLVQVGVDDLVQLPPGERDELARRLGRRLQQISTELGLRGPVHLNLNKADVIFGFREFFSHLPVAQRNDVFGFGLTVGHSVKWTGKDAAAHLDELCDVLGARATACLDEAERRWGRDGMEAVLCFPEELRDLRESLSRFIEVLGEPLAARPDPVGLSVYFTSVTQDERPPVGKYGGSLADLDLAPRTQRLQWESPTPYFVRGLFRHVVRNARRWPHATPRHFWLTVAAGTLACLGGTWLLAWRCQQDIRWLIAAEETVATLREGPGIERARLEDLDLELQQQLAVQDLLDLHQDRGRLWPVREEAARVLRERVDEQLLSPLRTVMERDISAVAFGRHDEPGEVFARAYRAMQADFILRRATCEHTTPMGRLRVLVDYAESLWLDQLGDKGRGAEAGTLRRRLQRVLAGYFDYYLRTDSARTGMLPEMSLQAEARDRLRQGSSRLNPALMFNLMSSSSGLYKIAQQLRGDVFADHGLPLAFTQDGCRMFWDTETSQGQEWWSCVLAVKAERFERKDMDLFYADQYQNAWKAWLAGLSLKREPLFSRNPRAALEDLDGMLLRLSRNEDSELEQVLRTVGKGTPWKAVHEEERVPAQDGYAGCQGKIGRKIVTEVPKPLPAVCQQCEDSFSSFARALPSEKPSELSSLYAAYQKALTALELQIRRLRRTTRVSDEALTMLMDTMKGSGELQDVASARVALMFGLKNQSPQKEIDPSGLDHALESVERSIWRAVVTLGADGLNSQWADEVYLKWREIHQRAQTDDSYCPVVVDFVKRDLEAYAQKNLLPFFEGGTCERRVSTKPFDSPSVNFAPDFCYRLREVMSLAQFITCPSPGPPAPPEPPREPRKMDFVGAPGCNGITEAMLDTGTKVYECSLASSLCKLRPDAAAGTEATLRVFMGWDHSWTTIARASSLDGLLAGRWVNQNRVKFIISRDLGGDCQGSNLTLDFLPRPGPARPLPDMRWRRLDLPLRVALPPRNNG